ncbi:MAG: hypothetical protein AABW87_01040, partial [Nanoarchaeota archaeon]
MGGIRDLGIAAGLAAGLAGCASNEPLEARLEKRLNLVVEENQRLRNDVAALSSLVGQMSMGCPDSDERLKEIEYARGSAATFLKHYVERIGYTGESNHSSSFSGVCIGKNEESGDMYFLTSSHGIEDPVRFEVLKNSG